MDDRSSAAAAAETIFAPMLTAPADRPFVVAQLGQTLDGRIATPTGESRWINGEDALDHLHRLRDCVDAVLVGVGTVIADDPMLNVRRVTPRMAGRPPARVIIDPGGRLPDNLKCLADDGARRIIVRACDKPAPDGVEIVRVEGGRLIHPQVIVEELFARGLRRLLVEGGAWTISSFIDADAVDRLHVLVAPMLLGSGKSGLSLAPVVRLAQARRPATRIHVFDDGDVLFDCDLRRDTKGG